MTGVFAGSTIALTDGSNQPVMNGPSHQHVNNASTAVTPSPANNGSTTQIVESVESIKFHDQSTFPHHRLDQKKSDVKNPLQMALESGAAFFGLGRKKDGDDDGSNGNSKVCTDESGEESSLFLQKRNISAENVGIDSGKKVQPGGLSATINSNHASRTKTARRPIPANIGSSSYQDLSRSSLHEAIHRQQSAPKMLSESPLSFGLSDSKSSSLGRTAENVDTPQDFYDPEDGHLWRAKFCVLEDGILYFYRNASDGKSDEAEAERKRSTSNMLGDDDNIRSNAINQSYITSGIEPGLLATSSSNGAINSRRRRTSAEDLSKSPMVRPGLHPLALHGDVCIWEKRVFMDCVGGVRTAEQQYGPNSFELQAMDDDESDHKLIDTLVLRARDPGDMKEWIFQFHRSLASFIMRNFIDVVGSTSSGGALSESYNPSSMLLSSRPTRHLSSSSLVESGSMSQSLSEKHLNRLMSSSPSLQHTLSHGHGRISLKRRMDIKRAPSDSASLSSTPETADMDYGHHHFAFREPSPNNIQLSPESSTPPLRVLIPPVQSFFPPANAGSFESAAPLRPTAPSLELNPRNPELLSKLSKTSEMHRPKPSVSSGKYIPPHQRSKSKYIPPHLRRQQDRRSIGCNDTTSIPLAVETNSKNDEKTREGSLASTIALAERSHFSPIEPPTEQRISHKVQKDTTDRLDIINPSTAGFVRGGCADPLLVQGSILDQDYIPKKASRLEKTRSEAFGSYGGSFSEDSKMSKSSLRWEIGAISECGVRESNEDAYLIANDLLDAFESSSYSTPPQTLWKEENTDHTVGLFGIFDGHCGNQGARFAVEQLGRFIHDELRFHSAEDAKYEKSTETSSLNPFKMESILREAMLKLDLAFCNLCQEEGREWESGATALVAMLANENLVIASLGDCRGFLCRFVDDAQSYVSDEDWEELEIDTDHLDQSSAQRSSKNEPLQRCLWREVTTVHSPSADKERARIENANGWITTETEIPIGQFRRMDFHDEDVIGILKRCLNHPSSSGSVTDSERSTKECKAAPQRILHISRVCGELAVSRALGDRDFKAAFNSVCTQRADTDDLGTKEDSSSDDNLLWESPLFLPYPENHNHQFRGDLVTNTPDFHRIRLGTEGVSNEFLLLACDGLWDVMDADDAIRVVRDLLFRKKVTAKKAAARLAELAIHLGSSDNITVLLLRLLPRDDVE